MNLKNTYKYLLLLIIVFVCYIGQISAQLSRSQIIGSYIYNFGNSIKWTSNNFAEFNIILISSNDDIIQELTKMSVNQKIQNKTISLSVLSEPNFSIKNAQLVFITNDKLSYYMSVFDLIERKEILLVSENFDNESYVMLNLYDTEDKNLLFEINRPNILNQSLILSDEILLMGGTEIDIASAYLKSQHSLRAMEIAMQVSVKQLDSLSQNIQESNLQVRQKHNLILLQTNKIDSQKLIQEQQLLKTNQYKTIITTQLFQLQTDKTILRKMVDSLSKNEKILQNQYIEIQNSKTIHSNQILKIDSINNEIAERNLILSDKEEIIGKQQSKMNLLIIIIFITITFIAIIFYAYRQNRKKSYRLYNQRKEIKQINVEFYKKNEELKSSLEEIKKMQQQLVQSEKMASLGVLSAGIAHEINNPINFVYAGINSLLRDFEDIEPIVNEISKINAETDNLKEKLQSIELLKNENHFDEAYKAIPEIIADIKLGAFRTAEIVKGLRSFSRTDKGELKYLNIHEGIETSLLLLKNKYKNHIEIIKNFDNKISDFKCYPGKINQVFLNIISNAIDAITESGKIWITTKTKQGNVIVSIKDTGCGMDAEMKEKLFDPFFTTKSVGEGTGLGLSITYGIIEEHNGKIKIISEPNKGSEFLIILPII